MSNPPVTPTTSPLPTPPGPGNVVRSTLAFQRSPLAFTGSLLEKYGDIASFRLATSPVVVLRHPHDLRHVLQKNSANYVRDTAAHKMARAIFGTGLPTMVGGAPWRRQRRLMQPAFHHERIQGLCDLILECVHETLHRWERTAADDAVVDITTEMSELTLRIAVRSLFSTELDRDTMRRFTQAVAVTTRELTAFMRLPVIPLRVPTPGHRHFWGSLRVINDIVGDVIAHYRRDDQDRGDLLSMLVHAQDEDTGERMSDARLRDEVFSMLFAGHETSANTLTWAWYLLARHPEVEQRVRAEIDDVLGGRPPTIDDFGALTYTRQVIDETARLYPQGWQGWRRAVEDDEIRGYRIAGGTDIFYSSYLTHRHPEFWSDPDTFDPERFAPEQVAARDRSAYLPFGAGPHLCIGQQLAKTEMLLTIARTLQRCRIVLTPNIEIAPKALVTLVPERPIRAMVRSRR